VKHIVSICNSLSDFDSVYTNLETATHIYHSIGVSPSEVQNPGLDWELKIIEDSKKDRIVAVGEIGLDYYRKFGNRDSQVELFIRQLELADKLDKPVIIHNREAGEDILNILGEKLPPRGGILHCYSENWEFARKALELNLFISFAGNVTYRNARNLHETAKNMPLERMLIESESPFMVPSAYRGKRNKPAYLHATAEFLAELRDMDLEEITDILYENSMNFFGITD
jgi:TatD DNase family protein